MANRHLWPADCLEWSDLFPVCFIGLLVCLFFSVEVNLDTVRVNLCVPYLLMVKRFFSDALQSPEDCHNVHLHQPSVPRRSMVYAASALRPSMTAPPSTRGEDRALTVCGRFKQLEVVLFAEPTEKHSRVLVLKVLKPIVRWLWNGQCRP